MDHDFALGIGSGLVVNGHVVAFAKLDGRAGCTVPMVQSSLLFQRAGLSRHSAGWHAYGWLSIALSVCLSISNQILKVNSSKNIAAK